MNNIYKLKSISIATIFSLFLVGCELGNIKTAISIEGRVAKGAIGGATVTAYKAGTTEVIGTATTDTNGYYKLDGDIFYDGVIYIESAGGTYTDELTNAAGKDASVFDLQAVSKVGADDGYVLNITPFSTVAYRTMQNDGADITSPTTVGKYNKAISDIFIGNGFDITKTTPNLHGDTTDNDLDSEDEEKYGFMLKVFTKMINSNEANVNGKINDIVGAIVSLDDMTITEALADEIITTFIDPVVATDMTAEEISDMNDTINDARDTKLPDISGSLAKISAEFNTTIATWSPVVAPTGGVITSCEISPDINTSYGLTFDKTNCQISGKPNKVNTESFTIVPANLKGKGNFFVISLEVNKTAQAPFSLDGSTVFEKNSTDYTQTTVGGSCVDGSLSFESNDTNVADITPVSGIIDFKNVGTVRITATLSCDEYNDISATKDITVNDVAPVITSPNDIVGEYNQTMTNWIPDSSTGGTISSCEIAPANFEATYGLEFNETTCEISGKPTTTVLNAGGINIQIKAINPTGDSTVSVNLKIDRTDQSPVVSIAPDQVCVVDDTFPQTATGGSSSAVGYIYGTEDPNIATVDASGMVTCVANGDVNITATKAMDSFYNASTGKYKVSVGLVPPNINNPQTTTGVYGEAVSWEVNNTGGVYDSCIITPNLAPDDITTKYGLVFDVGDCSIDGSPTATTTGDVSYTIKAVTADRGNSTKNINIIIDKALQSPFGFDDGITLNIGEVSPKALDHIGNGTGTISYVSTDENMAVVDVNSGAITSVLAAGTVEINATKQADNNYQIAHASYILTIQAADPNITSPGNIITEYNTTITTNWLPNNTNGGPIEECEILPLFTANSGMEFNTTTCEISGTPLYTKESGTLYTITAKNKSGAGVSTTSVKLTVNKADQDPLIVPLATVDDTMADVSHQQIITGGSGTGNITFSGAVAGKFTVDTNSGLVTYIDEIAGAVITVSKAEDDNYNDISTTYLLNIGDFKPEIGTSATVAIGTYNETNNTLWEANNTAGTATLGYETDPALPNGLSINNIGVIGGTPTSAMSATAYTIMAKNASGNDTIVVNITINKATQSNFVFNTGNRTGAVGTQYTYSVINTDVPAGNLIYTSSALGVDVSANTGLVVISPTATFGNVTISATNNGDGNYSSTTASYILEVTDQAPNIANPTTPNSIVGSYGDNIGFDFNNTGGTISGCVISSGTLPNGLAVAVVGNTCRIQGIVTEVKGIGAYTIQATNTAGDTSTRGVQITINKADQAAFTIYGDQTIPVTNTAHTQTADGGSTNEAILYSSSNTTVAHVDQNGLIAPHVAGNTTITAIRPGNVSYNDINDSYLLTVTDAVLPTVDYVASTPTNGAIDANGTADIIIVWSEAVKKIDGFNIEIKSKGNTAHVKGYTTNNIVANGDTNVTLSLGTGHLSYGEEYYIVIDAGAFEDMSGNDAVAQGGDGTWNFTVPTQTGDCAYDCVDNCDNY